MFILLTDNGFIELFITRICFVLHVHMKLEHGTLYAEKSLK